MAHGFVFPRSAAVKISCGDNRNVASFYALRKERNKKQETEGDETTKDKKCETNKYL